MKKILIAVIFTAWALCAPSRARADAPQWMHALVNAPLPPHDEKTESVLLYSERIFNVQANGKIKITNREAYKILRPGGRAHGKKAIYFDNETKIESFRGWCIPAQGKDFEVKEKEAVETAYFGEYDGTLVSDTRYKIIRVPAAEPGNIVGYEYEQDGRPYILEDDWNFQSIEPVREARYTLQLPPGWEYKAQFLNYQDVSATPLGKNQWQWVVMNVPEIRPEESMPQSGSVLATMVIAIFPNNGAGQRGFHNWKEMGDWEANLAKDRRTANEDIKRKVAEVTATAPTQLDKMRRIAKFVQTEIRYVGIQLGIGGWQPHYAADIFAHRYGDCKDKATITSTMLHEIGVQSYYVAIDTERGGAAPDKPAAEIWFDHEILAIALPDGMNDPSLVSVYMHPKLGRLLIFDPTDEYTPFGQLRGPLQANFGLLKTPDGGDLFEVPKLAANLNGTHRKAKLKLSESGTLSGDFEETRVGDPGTLERMRLKYVMKESERIKPIESLAAHSFGTYSVTKATVLNLDRTDMPFGYRYSLVAEKYAKSAGDLLLLRPRVIGSQSLALLETKEPRKFPVEFDGPSRDTDTFEITLPEGYIVEDLPPPVDADYSFASYHSKAEVNGNVLTYTRTYEVKELSVPVNKTDDLKKLYRIIASDERNTAVLKASAKP